MLGYEDVLMSSVKTLAEKENNKVLNFNETKVLLNLTHLPLTEIDNQYLIFFHQVGAFCIRKRFCSFQQIKLQIRYTCLIPVNGKWVKLSNTFVTLKKQIVHRIKVTMSE